MALAERAASTQTASLQILLETLESEPGTETAEVEGECVCVCVGGGGGGVGFTLGSKDKVRKSKRATGELSCWLDIRK